MMRFIRTQLFLPLLLALTCCPSWLRGLDLESFPRGNRLMLANTNVRVEPERETRLHAPASGLLRLNVNQREGELEAGEILGVMDRDRLELEQRLHDLEVALAEIREIPEWRLEQQTRQAALRERLNTLERQRDLLDRLSLEPEIARLYLSNNAEDADWKELFAARRAELDQDLDLISTVLSLMEAGDLETHHLEAEQIKRKQRALDLERRRTLSTLQMPFDGRYRLLFPLTQGQAEYRVESGQEIAILQDTRRFYAATPVQNSNWRHHPKEHLVLEIAVSPSSGSRLRARFYDEREIFTRNQPELAYVFLFPEDRSAEVEAVTGGSVPAVLWVELGETARMVPKMDLALAHPDLFRAKSWGEGALEIFPQARRVVVGATHVAIVASEE